MNFVVLLLVILQKICLVIRRGFIIRYIFIDLTRTKNIENFIVSCIKYKQTQLVSNEYLSSVK